MESSKGLQLQTGGTHLEPHHRPAPKPLQMHPLDVSSGDSGSESTSSTGSEPSTDSFPTSSKSSAGGSPTSSTGAEYRSSSPLSLPTSTDHVDTMRCCRCHQRSRSGLVGLRREDMVLIATNLYYCGRCANIVGFRR